MTYQEAYKLCVNKLNSAGILEAESDTRVLFDYLLQADRGFLFLHGEDSLSEDKEKRLLEAIDLRQKRIPVQHITGFQNFMGFEFAVNDKVLIPRFDTECLVEEAMLVCADGAKLLDVCTGSGCILISLMNYKNEIEGYGIDISKDALSVAAENARRLCKDSDRLPRFIESDLFTNLEEKDFDIILSNPPYIKSLVIEELEEEVKKYDPRLALDGGEDGLIFYRRICSLAPAYLKKGGHLLVEIGNDQGEEVRELFIENSFLDVKVIKDLAGNDRVVLGRLS